MDLQPAADQTGDPDAGGESAAAVTGGRRRVSGVAEMTAKTGEYAGGDVAPNDIDTTALHEKLHEAWSDGSGFWAWLTTTDHKSIGKRYLVTNIVMLVFGGVNALIMRTQLARPGSSIVGPDRYNQLFSVHGTNMMFLFAVPVMTAMGLYFVPLMLG